MQQKQSKNSPLLKSFMWDVEGKTDVLKMHFYLGTRAGQNRILFSIHSRKYQLEDLILNITPLTPDSRVDAKYIDEILCKAGLTMFNKILQCKSHTVHELAVLRNFIVKRLTDHYVSKPSTPPAQAMPRPSPDKTVVEAGVVAAATAVVQPLDVFPTRELYLKDNLSRGGSLRSKLLDEIKAMELAGVPEQYKGFEAFWKFDMANKRLAVRQLEVILLMQQKQLGEVMGVREN